MNDPLKVSSEIETFVNSKLTCKLQEKASNS